MNQWEVTGWCRLLFLQKQKWRETCYSTGKVVPILNAIIGIWIKAHTERGSDFKFFQKVCIKIVTIYSHHGCGWCLVVSQMWTATYCRKWNSTLLSLWKCCHTCWLDQSATNCLYFSHLSAQMLVQFVSFISLLLKHRWYVWPCRVGFNVTTCSCLEDCHLSLIRGARPLSPTYVLKRFIQSPDVSVGRIERRLPWLRHWF